MPELPDVELYLSLLRKRLIGQKLQSIKIFNPFVLRSVTPAAKDLEQREVLELHRLGKRVVVGFSDGFYLVVHLMIAGRFRWIEKSAVGTKLGGKIAVAALGFENGTLYLTEAGSKKRASITVIQGENALAVLDPGGVDVLTISLDSFSRIVKGQNHSIKDLLTDPHVFSGIGNAYSDEILHAAKISLHRRSPSLTDDEIAQLHRAMIRILKEWTAKLQAEFADRFPGAGDVTAFRPDFAVHGKFGKPCPVCGKPVQRIVYAENEANYCAECQNGGRILADRAMSRLLKDDRPKRV